MLGALIYILILYCFVGVLGITLLCFLYKFYKFKKTENADSKKRYKKQSLISGLICLLFFIITIVISYPLIYIEIIQPIKNEINKCRSDIIVNIDEKNILIPRVARIYKDRWVPENETETNCELRRINNVKKIYWKSIKISSPDEYNNENPNWWDWRKYEISQAENIETLKGGLKKYELEAQNKEIYVFDEGKRFTLNKEPIMFECIGLEKYLALKKRPNGKTRTNDWYSKYLGGAKYCFTMYLHNSGLVLSYSFFRKAHNAPYFPENYITIDTKMREQLSLFLSTAKSDRKRVANVVDDVIIHRFGARPDIRYKENKSYKCNGNITLNVNENDLRLTRTVSGAPTTNKIRLKNSNIIDANDAHPEYDCSIEYIDDVQSVSQRWIVGGLSFSDVNSYNAKYWNDLSKTKGITPIKLDDGTLSYKISENESIYILPLRISPTANNSPVKMYCKQHPKLYSCSTSYIHPNNFVVGYKKSNKEVFNALDLDIEKRKDIQKFLADANKLNVKN